MKRACRWGQTSRWLSSGRGGKALGLFLGPRHEKVSSYGHGNEAAGSLMRMIPLGRVNSHILCTLGFLGSIFRECRNMDGSIWKHESQWAWRQPSSNNSAQKMTPDRPVYWVDHSSPQEPGENWSASLRGLEFMLSEISVWKFNSKPTAKNWMGGTSRHMKDVRVTGNLPISIRVLP